MKNGKRIAALAGVVLLVVLCIVFFVSAIFAKPESNGLFMASLYSMIAVPILIYGFLLVYKQVSKKDEGISIRKLKKMNKELENEDKKSDKK